MFAVGGYFIVVVCVFGVCDWCYVRSWCYCSWRLLLRVVCSLLFVARCVLSVRCGRC